MNNSDAAPAVPRFDALMVPALKALKAMGGSATNQELLDKVIELEEFPIIRHSPDDIQLRGNRTTIPTPRERHPFRSHPMA